MPMKTELTWWERLLQLVCLLSIKDAEGVQVLGAAHLELDNILAPLDLHRTGILPPRSEKEVLDLMDLLRLQKHKWNDYKGHNEQCYRITFNITNDMAIGIRQTIRNQIHKLRSEIVVFLNMYSRRNPCCGEYIKIKEKQITVQAQDTRLQEGPNWNSCC
jgi:hypothetical protein